MFDEGGEVPTRFAKIETRMGKDKKEFIDFQRFTKREQEETTKQIEDGVAEAQKLDNRLEMAEHAVE